MTLWCRSDDRGRSLRVGGDARWRLNRQLDVKFMEKHLGVGVGLSISRQNQPAAIDGGNADIDHLNRSEFFHSGSWCQSWSMSHQPVLQRDLKTISEKCNED